MWLKRISIIILAITFVIIAVTIIFVINSLCYKERNDSMTELTELLGIDFKSVNITGIQCEDLMEDGYGPHTRIIAFFKESNETLQNSKYYENIFGIELERIPPGDIRDLGKIGIYKHNIQKYGSYFNEIEVDNWSTTYTIDWFQLDYNHDDKGNVVLLAYVPCKVTIDVDKVIKK